MADNEFIEKLLIHTPHEINTGTSQLQNIMITITATKEDTFNPGKFEVKESIFVVTPDKKIEDLIKDFKRQHKYPNDKYYLIYNNRLFENGTLAQAGITNRKKLTFFAPANEKKLAENEGFKLKFWSYPALCLAFSFLFAGLVCRFDYRLRGAYVLIGSLIGVPAMVCFIIGLTEAFSKATNTSFTGSEWFGTCYYEENSCCSCCCCCSKSKESTQ